MESQGNSISQIILKMRNKVGRLILSNLTNFYKSYNDQKCVVLHRSMQQSTQLKIDSRIYTHFPQRNQLFKWDSRVFSTNAAGVNGYPYAKENEVGGLPYTTYKN